MTDSTSIQLLVEAIDKASAVMNKITESQDKLGVSGQKVTAANQAQNVSSDKLMGGLGQLSQGILGVNLATVGWVGAGLAAVGMIKSSIDAAAEAQAVNVRLGAALRATGRDTEISAGQLEGMATSLEHVSAFDDEKIKAAYQALAQFENIPTGSINDITKAAMDMTAAMGGDLATNAETLGRILETGTTPKTLGFARALRDQISAQVKAGDTAAALSAILGGLNSRFSGQAAAQLNTLDGAQQHLTNAWKDYQESLANNNLPSIIGAENTLAGSLETATTNANLQAAAMKDLGDRALRATPPMLGLIDALKFYNDTRSKVEDNPIPGEPQPKKTPEQLAAERAAAAQLGVGTMADLTKIHTDYGVKLGDLQSQLDDATTLKAKEKIREEIQKTTEAYDKEVAAVQNELAIQGKAKDLFQNYGEILTTRNDLMQKGLVVTGGASQALQEEAGMLKGTREESVKAIPAIDGMTASTAALAKAAQDAQNEVNAARRQLAQFNGMTATATLYLVTVGSWDTGQVGGSSHIPGGVSPGTIGRGKAIPKAGGGPLQAGKWTLVGDMPGGGLAPYSELISPDNVVIPADLTRALVQSGLVVPQSAFIGGTKGKQLIDNGATPHVPIKVRAVKPGEGASRTLSEDAGSASIVQSSVAAAVTPLEVAATTASAQAQQSTQASLQANAAAAQAASTASTQQLQKLDDILTAIERLPTGEDMQQAFKVGAQQGI